MKYSIAIHKVIAIIGLLVLCSVQFFLVYNTYELKNDHYYLDEKNIINAEYSRAIRNDKVMPGGQRILDGFINRNMPRLEWAYQNEPRAFNICKQQVCDSAFASLRKANNMDSLLNAIIEKQHLNRYIKYALFIKSLDIAFQRDKYIRLYNAKEQYDRIDPAIQSVNGIRIGGTLQEIYPQALATSLSVSSSADYSYGITFALYVDTYNRKLTILRLMMPTFILSVLSILCVVFIFFITFKNWLKQKKLSEMKSDFINSITHEFHTPLSAIIVANRTMQNETVISDRGQLQPLTEVVQRQSERLKMLIGQVLQITTMNKIALKKAEHSLHHSLDELLLDYRLNIGETKVDLVLHKNAQKDLVPLDPFWFTTAFLNIFDNAVKYNDKDFKEIVVTTTSDRKGIYIAIQDNGIGMAPEVQKHIFEKFYRRIDNAGSQVKGLGLGLFYVKNAIDAHNWKIGIESEEGKGSIFTISIPI